MSGSTRAGLQPSPADYWLAPALRLHSIPEFKHHQVHLRDQGPLVIVAPREQWHLDDAGVGNDALDDDLAWPVGADLGLELRVCHVKILTFNLVFSSI